jgi:ribose transport system ATP-binding protein
MKTKTGAEGLVVGEISKTFAGTRALVDISATFAAGSITALLGQNGSGKSTLIKILAGFYHPDPGTGSISVNGSEMELPVHPHKADQAGVRFLHQDLGLVAELSVADNFAFVNGYSTGPAASIRAREMKRRVREALDRLKVDVDPSTKVADLTPTERTMVALARAFAPGLSGTQLRVLVLDEPTAALPAHEVETVFAALRHVRESGCAVIFVSHRIDEVMQICDQLVILRDGHLIAQRAMAGLRPDELVSLIIGKSVTRTYPARRSAPGDVIIGASGLSGRRLNDVDVQMRAGEIVGVTGLLGCGRSELCRLLGGAQRPRAGTIRLAGNEVSFQTPGDAVHAGVTLVPQDRRRDGCILSMGVRENLSLSGIGQFWQGGRLRRDLERDMALRVIGEFDIRPANPEALMSGLSGGNQQKAIVGKWTRIHPRVLILDEPTQGVDIGAKHEIGQIIRDLADAGVGILVGSSDFDELVPLCDRVLVLDRGHIVADVPSKNLSEEKLTMLCARIDEEAA